MTGGCEERVQVNDKLGDADLSNAHEVSAAAVTSLKMNIEYQFLRYHMMSGK